MQPSDNELLGKFIRDNDSGSLLELVQRHAPMVMGVCQSLLWHNEDAEDAFQATFLVLANKAPRLLQHSSIVGWLHQVAVRNCRNLQRQKKRKREVELNQEPAVDANEPWKSISDLHDRERVHAELAKLPKRYREVIILCHLEGRSRSEAAKALNCTTASIKASLARGRKLLKQRLIRHGIVASAMIGVLAAATKTAQANLNADLIRSTVQLCQGNSIESGPASSTDFIQQLAQQELSGMNLISLSKAAVYAAVGISLIGLPLALWAQSEQEKSTAVSINAQAGDLDSPAIKIESSQDKVAAKSEGNLQAEPIALPGSQDASSIDNELADPLLEASKNSVDYWLLMREAASARIEDLQMQKLQVEQGDIAVTPFAIRANMLEEQAKILQIDLLLKKIREDKKKLEKQQNPSQFIPPSPTANFQPGDVLTVESNSEPLIEHRSVVTADYHISLPLIGSTSVKDLNQKQLRSLLEKRYAEYIKSPMIDIYRELPPRTGNDIPRASTEALQPGETITIADIQNTTFNRRVIVQEDCSVTVPLLGTIQGKGLTPEEFSRKLNIAAKKFIKEPSIQVSRGCLDDPRQKIKEFYSQSQ